MFTTVLSYDADINPMDAARADFASFTPDPELKEGK